MCGIIHQVKTYGKICGFYLGSQPIVVISDYQLIKEACKLEALTGRPSLPYFEICRPGHELMRRELNGSMPGVLFSYGKYWKDLRRFMLRNLRDLGFGKTSMEDVFHDEVDKLNKYLLKFEGKPINLTGTMNLSIVNALWSIITGERMEIDDPDQHRVVNLINNFIAIVSLSGNNPLAAILPTFMIKWPVLDTLSGYKVTKAAVDGMREVVEPYIEQHKKTFDPNNIRDFLDLMLAEVNAEQDPESCFGPKLGQATIVNSLMDLFLAGMETTSSSLVMVVLQLLHHPDVQDKVHKELDSVVGRDRMPSLEDQGQLPYVCAVVLESLRITSLVPLGAPHHALEDVPFHGYVIPKDTTVLSSIYSVARDPECFADPELFIPDRFINSDGNFVPDERVCLGQSLAEKEFFIFFSALLQKFRFLPVPGSSFPSYVDIRHPVSLLRVAPAFEVILERRF